MLGFKRLRTELIVELAETVLNSDQFAAVRVLPLVKMTFSLVLLLLWFGYSYGLGTLCVVIDDDHLTVLYSSTWGRAVEFASRFFKRRSICDFCEDLSVFLDWNAPEWVDFLCRCLRPHATVVVIILYIFHL